MARGRLISAFLADLRRLDTAAVAAASSYDEEFREVKRTADGSWEGASGRVEAAAIMVRCQIEDQEFQRMAAVMAGIERKNRLALVCHFRDLDRAGLVNTSTGNANLQVAARLVAIYDLAGNIQQTMPGDGLYCVETRPIGYGIGRRLNLLLLAFEDRAQSAQS